MEVKLVMHALKKLMGIARKAQRNDRQEKAMLMQIGPTVTDKANDGIIGTVGKALKYEVNDCDC